MDNLRKTRLRQGYAEAGDLRIFITLRVVKSTPVALVKLRGAQLNQAGGGLGEITLLRKVVEKRAR